MKKLTTYKIKIMKVDTSYQLEAYEAIDYVAAENFSYALLVANEVVEALPTVPYDYSLLISMEEYHHVKVAG
jgi:hypothetical protein